MRESTTAHLFNTELLAAEASRFTALLREIGQDDWATPVPSCPGWDVRKLVRHLGTTHCWARTMVERRAVERLDTRSLTLDLPRDAGGLPHWFEDGAASLAATLRAADGDADMWSWGVDQHVRFWSRRMLHETSVHRADLEGALGRESAYDAAVAVDGIDEFLENLPTAAAFSKNVRKLTGDGETLHLHATDTADMADMADATGATGGTPGTAARAAATPGAEWLITLEHDGFRWGHAHAKGAVAVRGPVSELYLFVWGRRGTDAERIEVVGDETLLDHWVKNASS